MVYVPVHMELSSVELSSMQYITLLVGDRSGGKFLGLMGLEIPSTVAIFPYYFRPDTAST